MQTTRDARSECNGWPRGKAHILVQSHQRQLARVHGHSLKRQGNTCACQLWAARREETAGRGKTYVKGSASSSACY